MGIHHVHLTLTTRCISRPIFVTFSENRAQKTETLITHEDGSKNWKNNCWQHREDYFECLHAKKEWAMVRRVNEEEKRQAKIAADGQ